MKCFQNQFNMHKKAIIIGGGLTGLVTAFYLKKRNIPFLVLEKDSRVGGAIQTRHEDGFSYEAGPNTGVISHPEVAELFEDLNSLCKLEIADERAKKRLIWKNGKWEPIPSGLAGAIKTPLFSFRDKIRILGEPFRSPGKDPDESLASLVKRRMGESFLNYAVDPFVKGVYAGDTEYLIPRYALPKLYRLEQEYGSFIGGSIKKKMREKDPRMKKATREVFSVEGGLENLIRALETAIGKENIYSGQENIKVERQASGKFITRASTQKEAIEISSDYVITTTGSYELMNILPFIKDEVENIDNLLYARIAEIAFGFKQWNGIPLDAFGGLVPSLEQRNILGVLFPSAFLKNRAPKGGALLACFLGGVKKDYMLDKSDEQLIRIASDEVKTMMGLKEFNPDLVRLFRYEHAIPQYGIHTGERLERIKKVEQKHPGLLLAGNIRDGIGMADRIRQGVALAGSIAEG